MSKKKFIKIIQVSSAIGRTKKQKETLKGLGLNKINKTRELEDTPAVRGMMEKVKHLISFDLN